MVQEYVNDFRNYVGANLEYIATFIVLSVGMATMVYFWIRSEVGVLSGDDRRALFWLGSIFVIPVMLSVVAALTLIGLISAFQYIFYCWAA